MELQVKILNDVTELTKAVTDKEPSRDWLKEFERLRIDCVYPEKM